MLLTNRRFDCDPRAKLLHCVRTTCKLCTQRLGYSPKNTCHLSGITAKQQSPHENNEIAFNLVLHCHYEQTTQPCKVQLCRGMQDAHMFKSLVPFDMPTQDHDPDRTRGILSITACLIVRVYQASRANERSRDCTCIQI